VAKSGKRSARSRSPSRPILLNMSFHPPDRSATRLPDAGDEHAANQPGGGCGLRGNALEIGDDSTILPPWVERAPPCGGQERPNARSESRARHGPDRIPRDHQCRTQSESQETPLATATIPGETRTCHYRRPAAACASSNGQPALLSAEAGCASSPLAPGARVASIGAQTRVHGHRHELPSFACRDTTCFKSIRVADNLAALNTAFQLDPDVLCRGGDRACFIETQRGAVLASGSAPRTTLPASSSTARVTAARCSPLDIH